MPIYTYQCESCGVRFDRFQKFSDQPLTWCPECGKKALRKVYSPVGIVFKGSGFYATDHRSPSGMTSYNKDKSEESPKTETEKKPAEAAKPAVEAKPGEPSSPKS